MKALGRFIKNNWLIVIIFELCVIAASIMSVFFLPYFRNNQIALGVVFVVLFAVFAAASFYLSRRLIKPLTYDKETINAMFYFYIFSLFLSGIVVTVIFVTIRAVDPKSIFLVQGFLSIVALLAYYISIGICFYVKKR